MYQCHPILQKRELILALQVTPHQMWKHTLSTINGSIIHREVINNVQPNSINKLNLKQQPAPGVYILKLKAEGAFRKH